MFLKAVPPAVATHSEWMSSKSCSLPLFFNESASDSDLASIGGTPFPRKIQMIIESLQSTSESSDMNENEKAAHSNLGFTSQVRLMDIPVISQADNNRQTTRSDTGEDSDSDDSVDKGIEEAIQEYLKENHKRKRESLTGLLPVPKLKRREPTVPDSTKQQTHSPSAKRLATSNRIQVPALKKAKNKKEIKESLSVTPDLGPVLPVACLPFAGLKKDSSSELDRSPPHLVIKEKKEWQDSSSDEGIEEAIRRFQEEKHKQKKKESHIKPARCVPRKPAVDSAEHVKTVNKLSKKYKKPATNKSSFPEPQNVFNVTSQDYEVSTPPAPKAAKSEHQIRSKLKVNTAELMCAEAILDISKTVMPEVFESSLNRALCESPAFSSFPPTEDKSDDGSIDSEDGIEQEIMNFLELKAKMNKELPGDGEQSPASRDPSTCKETRRKLKESQSNKVVRLSLSKKRKLKGEQSKLSSDGDLVVNVKQEITGTPFSHKDISTSFMLHSTKPTLMKIDKRKQNSPSQKNLGFGFLKDASSPKTVTCSEKNDSSDKSSSLDSDEDLDAAIKDLLKTKKKVKKKVRDLNALKNVKSLESSSVHVLKKQKPIPSNKLHKVAKGGKKTLNTQAKRKTVKGKHHVQSFKLSHSEVSRNGVDFPSSSLHPDDDSSVDSEDGIEQEIRKFLAERAKVSGPLATLTKPVEETANSLISSVEIKPKLRICSNESTLTSTPDRLLKNEEESIDIQTKSMETELNKGPALTPSSSFIMSFKRTDDHEIDSAPTDPINGSLQTRPDTPTATPANSKSPWCQHQNLFLMRPVYINHSETKESPTKDCEDLSISQPNKSATRTPLKEVISSLCPTSPSVSPRDLLNSTPIGDTMEGYNRLKRNVQLSKTLRLSSHMCQSKLTPQYHQSSSVIQVQHNAGLDQNQTMATEAPPSLVGGEIKGGSVSKEDKKQEDEEENCIDETEVESDEERKDQTTKDRIMQHNNQYYSTSIDPGPLLSPYIALETEERRLRFRDRSLKIQKHLQDKQTVKQKLQFVVRLLR